MTAEQVVAIVNEVLIEARDDVDLHQGQPVNWARVGCNEARLFADGGWYVVIDKASPDAHRLEAFVTEHLAERGIVATVKCEW